MSLHLIFSTYLDKIDFDVNSSILEIIKKSKWNFLFILIFFE